MAGLIVAIFAIFHGHAHGTELPEAVHALGYSGGFVLATGLLHLFGIAFGLLTLVPGGQIVVAYWWRFNRLYRPLFSVRLRHV